MTPKYLQVTSICTGGIFSMSSEIDWWCKTANCSPDADLAFLRSGGVLLANVRELIGLALLPRFVTDRLDESAVGRSSDADMVFSTCGIMLSTSSVEGVDPVSSPQFVTCSPPVISIATLKNQ